MKGYFNVTIRILVTLLLVAIPALGFAENPLFDTFRNLSFDPPLGDASVGFLTKMFGAVPGVPHLAAGGQTIIGVIFGVFNAGILALSGVFLTYTITRVLTETTMDGSAMGKSTTIWTAIRCALSTSLLVPQASGYSMINGIIMWVVIQSVGLADLTWNRALDYLKEGGPLYAPPTAMVDYTLINPGIHIDGKDQAPISKSNDNWQNVGSADVLRSLTCSYAVHGALAKSQGIKRKSLYDKMQKYKLTDDETLEYSRANKTIPVKSTDGVFSIYHHVKEKCKSKKKGKCVGGYTNGVFQFPYVKNENKNPLKGYGLNIKDDDIPTNLTGLCGTISYIDMGDKTSGEDYAKLAERYIPSKLKGLEDMLIILEPTAKDIISKATIDKERKIKLEPNKYIVYEDDAGEHKFLSKEGDYSKQNIDNLRTVLNPKIEDSDFGNIPTINWPLGSDEILSAAAAYQIALTFAQMGSAEDSKKDRDKKFDEAKEFGWIGAGGYYRLLNEMQSGADKEYSYYRLRGYEYLNKPFADTKISVRTKIPYSTLFAGAVSKNKSGKTPIGVIDMDYQKGLNRALTWLYLSYPYSKLHGRMLATSLAKTTSGADYSAPMTMFWGAGDGHTKKVGKVLTEIAIWAAASGGAVLLATLPPLAVPILTPIPLLLLQFEVDQVFASWTYNMGPKGPKDPIIKLQNLGTEMLKSAVGYVVRIQAFFVLVSVAVTTAAVGYQVASWGAAAGSFMSTLLGVSSSTETSASISLGMLDMIQTIIFMIVPLAISVIGPLFVSGVIFSVYVPLIPYLLFLFGAISWLISVLVLMAAAPVICFLMLWGSSSQENPLLAREAEQFVMQVVGVFLRPTLMVIGLIAGMVLVYIGVDILNLGFFNLTDVIMGEGGSYEINLIKQIGIVAVYTFTMLTVVNMCYSPIYLLYSEAMRIAGISAPAVGMEERQLEVVKGAATQLAETGAGGMKEQAVSMKGMRGQAQQGKKEGSGSGTSGAEGDKKDDDKKDS